MAVFVGYAYRKGWHDLLWRYRVRVSIIATPVLVVALWLGWSLASPLFTNTSVDEEFPFAFTATVPADMDIEEIEMVMAGMAKVVSPVDEEMPAMLTMPAGSSPGTSTGLQQLALHRGVIFLSGLGRPRKQQSQFQPASYAVGNNLPTCCCRRCSDQERTHLHTFQVCRRNFQTL